jgi:hypothetical protein
MIEMEPRGLLDELCCDNFLSGVRSSFENCECLDASLSSAHKEGVTNKEGLG